MVVITERRKIGSICGHTIYAVAKTEMIPVHHSSVLSNLTYSKNEKRSFAHFASNSCNMYKLVLLKRLVNLYIDCYKMFKGLIVFIFVVLVVNKILLDILVVDEFHNVEVIHHLCFIFICIWVSLVWAFTIELLSGFNMCIHLLDVDEFHMVEVICNSLLLLLSIH